MINKKLTTLFSFFVFLIISLNLVSGVDIKTIYDSTFTEQGFQLQPGMIGEFVGQGIGEFMSILGAVFNGTWMNNMGQVVGFLRFLNWLLIFSLVFYVSSKLPLFKDKFNEGGHGKNVRIILAFVFATISVIFMPTSWLYAQGGAFAGVFYTLIIFGLLAFVLWIHKQLVGEKDETTTCFNLFLALIAAIFAIPIFWSGIKSAFTIITVWMIPPSFITNLVIIIGIVFFGWLFINDLNKMSKQECFKFGHLGNPFKGSGGSIKPSEKDGKPGETGPIGPSGPTGPPGKGNTFIQIIDNITNINTIIIKITKEIKEVFFNMYIELENITKSFGEIYTKTREEFIKFEEELKKQNDKSIEFYLQNKKDKIPELSKAIDDLKNYFGKSSGLFIKLKNDIEYRVEFEKDIEKLHIQIETLEKELEYTIKNTKIEDENIKIIKNTTSQLKKIDKSKILSIKLTKKERQELISIKQIQDFDIVNKLDNIKNILNELQPLIGKVDTITGYSDVRKKEKEISNIIKEIKNKVKQLEKELNSFNKINRAVWRIITYASSERKKMQKTQEELNKLYVILDKVENPIKEKIKINENFKGDPEILKKIEKEKS